MTSKDHWKPSALCLSSHGECSQCWIWCLHGVRRHGRYKHVTYMSPDSINKTVPLGTHFWPLTINGLLSHCCTCVEWQDHLPYNYINSQNCCTVRRQTTEEITGKGSRDGNNQITNPLFSSHPNPVVPLEHYYWFAHTRWESSLENRIKSCLVAPGWPQSDYQSVTRVHGSLRSGPVKRKMLQTIPKISGNSQLRSAGSVLSKSTTLWWNTFACYVIGTAYVQNMYPMCTRKGNYTLCYSPALQH